MAGLNQRTTIKLFYQSFSEVTPLSVHWKNNRKFTVSDVVSTQTVQSKLIDRITKEKVREWSQQLIAIHTAMETSGHIWAIFHEYLIITLPKLRIPSGGGEITVTLGEGD